MPEDKSIKYILTREVYRTFNNSTRLKQYFNSPDDFIDFADRLYEESKKD